MADQATTEIFCQVTLRGHGDAREPGGSWIQPVPARPDGCPCLNYLSGPLFQMEAHNRLAVQPEADGVLDSISISWRGQVIGLVMRHSMHLYPLSVGAIVRLRHADRQPTAPALVLA